MRVQFAKSLRRGGLRLQTLSLGLALLFVLAGPAAAWADDPPERYVIQPGDTLTSIAQRFGLDVAQIMTLNSLSDADAIVAGTSLRLSRAGSPVGQRPAAATTLPMSPAPTSASTSYQVQPGDTLYSIARRFGVAPQDVVAMNRLDSADRIVVGMTLRIAPSAGPRDAASGVVNAAWVPPGGNSVLPIALQYRGAPYVFGGTTPAGFDCSGFAYFVFQMAGRPIPRNISDQYDAGVHPKLTELRPGDLVFFQNTYTDGLSHNGIYIDNGQFIHAADEVSGVTISRLSDPYWADRWYGAARIG